MDMESKAWRLERRLLKDLAQRQRAPVAQRIVENCVTTPVFIKSRCLSDAMVLSAVCKGPRKCCCLNIKPGQM
jgi:hypothetical protein